MIPALKKMIADSSSGGKVTGPVSKAELVDLVASVSNPNAADEVAALYDNENSGSSTAFGLDDRDAPFVLMMIGLPICFVAGITAMAVPAPAPALVPAAANNLASFSI